MCGGAHGVRDQPVHGFHDRWRLAAFSVHAHRAAQRDDLAHALTGLVRAVEREHTTQAPAHQADLAPGLVMQKADLLLQRLRVAAAKAHIAPEAPRLHLVATVGQVGLQRKERAFVAHEAGHQEHRVAVALGRLAQ